MVYSNLSKINKACIEHTFSQITKRKKKEKQNIKNLLINLTT